MNRVRPGVPSLFRQIASRLALMLVLFVVVEALMVIGLYATDLDGLGQDLVDLEAARVFAARPAALASLPPPYGVEAWDLTLYARPPEGPDGGAGSPGLLSWTRRDVTPGGVRISGVRSDGAAEQTRWVRMAFTVNGLTPYAPAILKELGDHLVGPLVPLVALLYLFITNAVRRLLAPLRKAVREVDGLSPKAPGQRLSEPPAPREVRALVEGFNRALERMDLAIDKLHGFTAQVAHELRNPIMVLKLAVAEVEPQDLREQLELDLVGMTRLVNQLLDLAHAEALTIEGSERLDLDDLARQIVSRMVPVALSQGRELEFVERGGPYQIVGNADALGRALTNLIDNAMKYGGSAPGIEIAVGPGPILSVRDHGPGLEPGDTSRIFDRFWRKRSGDTAGAGLGLEIVRTIITNHGGQVMAGNAPGGGAIFVLDLHAETTASIDEFQKSPREN